VIVSLSIFVRAATAQTSDRIDATPQEAVDEIIRNIESYGCANIPVSAGYKHPFLTLEYNRWCSTAKYESIRHVVQQINVTLIASASVSTYVEFVCSDICDFEDGYFEKEGHIRRKSSSGSLIMNLDKVSANRVAKALVHLGLLYQTQRTRNKFD
jgi:hypothetical protein